MKHFERLEQTNEQFKAAIAAIRALPKVFGFRNPPGYEDARNLCLDADDALTAMDARFVVVLDGEKTPAEISAFELPMHTNIQAVGYTSSAVSELYTGVEKLRAIQEVTKLNALALEGKDEDDFLPILLSDLAPSNPLNALLAELARETDDLLALREAMKTNRRALLAAARSINAGEADKLAAAEWNDDQKYVPQRAEHGPELMDESELAR